MNLVLAILTWPDPFLTGSWPVLRIWPVNLTMQTLVFWDLFMLLKLSRVQCTGVYWKIAMPSSAWYQIIERFPYATRRLMCAKIFFLQKGRKCLIKMICAQTRPVGERCIYWVKRLNFVSSFMIHEVRIKCVHRLVTSCQSKRGRIATLPFDGTFSRSRASTSLECCKPCKKRERQF